ncbi:MAG TPA: AsnC family transcriptional regulator [Candidatus Bathyarchaeia archaeon]|nr:AsnC family transcriptional regulator [Candidatus Bathyarchaeia archaeon]
MRNKLDMLDARIIEGLAQYGPRNTSEIARKLRLPRGTVASRIRRMSPLFNLRTHASVYHTNIGLKKTVVFAQAAPGQEELLFNCMKMNDFYIYISRCYGMFEGCLGIYITPVEQSRGFEHFIEEIKDLRVAQKVEVLWSTCFHTVNPTTKWFDKTSEEWIFPWSKWIYEIATQGSQLPYTLVDPKAFPIRADATDLFILKELEKDATIDLVNIARKLGTTLQNVRHHYTMHVLKRGLVETFQVGIAPFDRAISDMLFFVFRFESMEKMAKFARSLLDKPFVYIVGKILGESAIVSQVCLPRPEFRNFVDSLSKLARAGYLVSYDYVFQDLSPGKWSRQTIPYEHFENGSWVYDNEKHIRNVREIVESNLKTLNASTV